MEAIGEYVSMNDRGLNIILFGHKEYDHVFVIDPPRVSIPWGFEDQLEVGLGVKVAAPGREPAYFVVDSWESVSPSRNLTSGAGTTLTMTQIPNPYVSEAERPT